MKSKTLVVLSISVIALTLLGVGSNLLAEPPRPGAERDASTQREGDVAEMVGSGFTYQGHLADGGSPANGSYDFEFRLYDDPDTGAQVGDTVTVDDKTVTGGLFTVELDFGSGAFNGEARYLEIGVRPGSSTGVYTILLPRQPLTAAPFALSLPGLYTQPGAGIPNVIGGWAHNLVWDEVMGATISGGGGPDDIENVVTDRFGTIGGGANNLAGDESEDTTDAWFPTVGGGWENKATNYNATVAGGAKNTASGGSSFVGGGWLNVASGENHATVCGGVENEASGEEATVGGGGGNTASGWAATVGGGQENTASGNYAAVGGGYFNTAVYSYTTIGGGEYNTASGDWAAIGGGDWNTASGVDAVIGGGYANTASGWAATVGGGGDNTADAWAATISGGYTNTVTAAAATVGGGEANYAGAENATIGGGYWNVSYGLYSTIGGGETNFINWDYATIGGGRNNQIYADYGTICGGGGEDSTSANIVYDNYGTIGGGNNNKAGTEGVAWDEPGATVAGGVDNTANDIYATVGGGNNNEAISNQSTVAGGSFNKAEASFSTVSGGSGNKATHTGSTVSGGSGNEASGLYATVPGGQGNTAVGVYSFAAGNGATADHNGTFVWADATSGTFSSTADNQFLIRASGGVGIGTDSPEQPLHIRSYSPFVQYEDIDGGNEWAAGVHTAGSEQYFIVYEKTSPTEWTSRFWVRNDGTTGVSVLQIVGGSDFAEPFDIFGAENVEPGMVVSIDPEHPGQLRLSETAHDRMVAGCVSGANGINPGLIMGQEGSEADGELPVALSGRVYCWADASYGPIQPGDLLTTSDTRGHVMKVGDYELAQGAVIGKAMSALDEGRGLILILVSLQ